MMQHRHQQKQSSMISRTNLSRQLPIINNQQHSCRSTSTSLSTTITTLVPSSTIATSSLPTSSSSSSLSSLSSLSLPSSTYSSCSPLSFNKTSVSNTTRNNSSSGYSCSSVLLSVFAWSITLLFISSCFGFTDASVIKMTGQFSKRAFMDLGCKGVYDVSAFAILDRLCEDCYNLFRAPELHGLCKGECFTSQYFKGCMETLQFTSDEEQTQYQTAIKKLHGAEPFF